MIVAGFQVERVGSRHAPCLPERMLDRAMWTWRQEVGGAGWVVWRVQKTGVWGCVASLSCSDPLIRKCSATKRQGALACWNGGRNQDGTRKRIESRCRARECSQRLIDGRFPVDCTASARRGGWVGCLRKPPAGGGSGTHYVFDSQVRTAMPASIPRIKTLAREQKQGVSKVREPRFSLGFLRKARWCPSEGPFGCGGEPMRKRRQNCDPGPDYWWGYPRHHLTRLSTLQHQLSSVHPTLPPPLSSRL